MSAYFYSNPHHQHPAQNPHPMAPSNHHHGRSRRAPRLSTSQNSNRQYRQPKPVREVVIPEAPSMNAYRARFEAGRSFDLDDDLEFCPHLLTFDEKQSVSSGSDRSSLSSGSPDASPLQHQIQPQITSALSMSAATASAYIPANYSANLKLHQPAARSRNAIPIVNPTTGIRIASPPSSISPNMMQTNGGRRW